MPSYLIIGTANVERIGDSAQIQQAPRVLGIRAFEEEPDLRQSQLAIDSMIRHARKYFMEYADKTPRQIHEEGSFQLYRAPGSRNYLHLLSYWNSREKCWH